MARRQPRRSVSTNSENQPKACSRQRKSRSKQTKAANLNAQQKRELVLQKQRERMMKLRAKRREDPEELEMWRAKERKVWKERVKEGRVKRVADMTSKERKVVRERRRKSAQKWRMKQKEKEPKKISHQKREAKRKIKKANSALHRKLAKESKQRKVLQRALWRERKKNRKLREAMELTPRSAVRKEFRGKKLSPAVQRKLVFSEVMKKELKVALKTCSKSHKAKQALHKLITGKVLKKYRMLKESKCLSKKARCSAKKSIKKGYGILEYHKAPSEVQLKVQADVQAFFTSDECSAVNPCAKGHVKKRCHRKRKKVVKTYG